MLQWSDRPSREQRAAKVPLIRVRVGRPYIAIVLSDDLTGAFTHYWFGRTRICTRPTCEPCEAGRLPRWYGYLPTYQPAGQFYGLLELTPATLDTIEPLRAAVGSLRGYQITATRSGNKQNSPLAVRLKPGPLPADCLPAGCDVRALLSKLWEINVDATSTGATRLPA